MIQEWLLYDWLEINVCNKKLRNLVFINVITETGAKVEGLLLQEGVLGNTNEYQTVTLMCLVGIGEFIALTFPARKLKPGTLVSSIITKCLQVIHMLTITIYFLSKV